MINIDYDQVDKISKKLKPEEKQFLRRVIHALKTDELTDVANRRAFEGDIKDAVTVSENTKKDVSLLIFDIDNFKKVNDSMGHKTGDYVLQRIAKCLKIHSRNDQIYRIGGEEFALIIKNTDLKQGRVVAERLRQSVEDEGKQICKELKEEGKKDAFEVTISIGVANYKGNCNSVKELFEKADQALYKAKDAGRNKVMSI